MSLALARKYRPATFDDLIGQEAVAQTLRLALDTKRLAHAYLFSGLRGSGKTSTARIFAKALLCERGESSNPCGTCDQCLSASENRHMDIIEMDAASNRGIDDIKELIEHTKYKPSMGRYKIFIIDEVHMLTTQAFNALLKTLEEPPEFVKFILATTDPLKLPATILSRTQHFRFKKIPQQTLVTHLQSILNKEGIAYENSAIEIIARSGAGSVRDALTLLDQAIVYAKNNIDVKTVTQMLGIIEPSKLNLLLEAISKKDQNTLLRFIDEASSYEADMVIDELTLLLKEMLLEQTNTLFEPLQIDRFFRILSEAKQLLSIGSDEGFVLSLTLFKMSEALELQEIDNQIRLLRNSIEQTPATPKTPPLDSQNSHRQHLRENTATPTRNDTSEKVTENQTLHRLIDEEVDKTYDIGKEKFKQLTQKLYDRDYKLGETFQTHIRYLSFENGTLIWESSAEGEAKKLLIKGWGVIKLFVQEIFGFDTLIENRTKKKPSQIDDTNPLPPQTPPAIPNSNQTAPIQTEPEMKSSCIAPEAGDTEAAKEKDPAELLEEPMVKEALELLAPKKVRIKRKT